MKKLPWYLYMVRFLFDPCCEYCTNIAVRKAHPGNHKYCWNHINEAQRDAWTPFGQGDLPLDGSTAWKYDPQYFSPFQWLWVKLKIKEKGQPIRY